MISLVTGHVKLENDKVFVSDEYEISADVDTATGDIDLTEMFISKEMYLQDLK